MATHSQTGHPDSLPHTVAEVLHDVADLAQLQWELLAIDTAQARRQAMMPLAILLAGVAVILGTVPVLVLGVGELLVYYAHFPAGWAYLLAGALALTAGAVAAKIAVDRLRSAAECFTRSREELQENIQWMRRVVRAHGRSEHLQPRRPQRTSP